MRRGEIWWGTLDAPAGSAPGFSRPLLIVQADSFNESRIRTAIVAALTTNERLAAAPAAPCQGCRAGEGFRGERLANPHYRQIPVAREDRAALAAVDGSGRTRNAPRAQSLNTARRSFPFGPLTRERACRYDSRHNGSAPFHEAPNSRGAKMSGHSKWSTIKHKKGAAGIPI